MTDPTRSRAAARRLCWKTTTRGTSRATSSRFCWETTHARRSPRHVLTVLMEDDAREAQPAPRPHGSDGRRRTQASDPSAAAEHLASRRLSVRAGRMEDMAPADPLAAFSPATATWFGEVFAAPTAAQRGAWEAVSAGDNALVIAPTGSGKTLAAFLWALDDLARSGPVPAKERCRVLYVSPLKALAVDVERNLRAPLTGITQTAVRIGQTPPAISVGVRSGDTSAADRRAIVSRPPDILITTPESLFLMLTSAARETLRHVRTVIVDEVHALAGTKRGAHLALSLERLQALTAESAPTGEPARPIQRIGLSATVRPAERVARFLGGHHPVRIIAPPAEKSWDLRVVVPVEDMSELGSTASVPAPTLDDDAPPPTRP